MVDNMIRFQFRRSLTNVTCIITKIFLPQLRCWELFLHLLEMWCSPWICVHVFLWFQTVLLQDFYNHKWLKISNDEEIYTAAFKIWSSVLSISVFNCSSVTSTAESPVLRGIAQHSFPTAEGPVLCGIAQHSFLPYSGSSSFSLM